MKICQSEHPNCVVETMTCPYIDRRPSRPMAEESDARGGATISGGGWVSPDRMMIEVFCLMCLLFFFFLSCNLPEINPASARTTAGTLDSNLACVSIKQTHRDSDRLRCHLGTFGLLEERPFGSYLTGQESRIEPAGLTELPSWGTGEWKTSFPSSTSSRTPSAPSARLVTWTCRR